MKRLLASAMGLCLSIPAVAQFHDNGFTQTPIVKTEYTNSQTGTAAVPLVIGTCLWGNCGTERTVYPQSNYWRQNWPCNADSCVNPVMPYDVFWALILNNEPRQDTHNSGPPDVSLPRAVPGSGLMGFLTVFGNDNFPGDTHWRAHLVMNFLNYTNPVVGGIPFEGFGEFSSRGNGNHTLAWLRPSPSTRVSVLTFGERLWGVTIPTPVGSQPATLATYVWALANWGTKPKAIFITLYHYNLQNSQPPGLPAKNHFSWPISQSALYPGADIAYFDAEDVSYYCPGMTVPSLVTGQDVNYRIDLTQLFVCANNHGLWGSEPMPSTSNIPVTQVLWASEATGVNGSIWVDVHSQKLVTTTGMIDGSDETPESAALEPQSDVLGFETNRIADDLKAGCEAVPGCPQRQAILTSGQQSALELPIGLQPTQPELRAATLRDAGIDSTPVQ